jgi:hypothetical protein
VRSLRHVRGYRTLHADVAAVAGQLQQLSAVLPNRAAQEPAAAGPESSTGI